MTRNGLFALSSFAALGLFLSGAGSASAATTDALMEVHATAVADRSCDAQWHASPAIAHLHLARSIRHKQSVARAKPKATIARNEPKAIVVADSRAVASPHVSAASPASCTGVNAWSLTCPNFVVVGVSY